MLLLVVCCLSYADCCALSVDCCSLRLVSWSLAVAFDSLSLLRCRMFACYSSLRNVCCVVIVLRCGVLFVVCGCLLRDDRCNYSFFRAVCNSWFVVSCCLSSMVIVCR